MRNQTEILESAEGQAFLHLDTEAGDEDALLDALEKLLPSRAEVISKVTCSKPNEYIRQLDHIRMAVDVKIDAAINYVTAQCMYERWRANHIDAKKIQRHLEVLIKKYNVNFATYKDQDTDKVKCGKNIFRETCRDVENIREHGLPFVRNMNEGLLHQQADKHKIGWHPDWEHL